MRQAGGYLPSYARIKGEMAITESGKGPGARLRRRGRCGEGSESTPRSSSLTSCSLSRASAWTSRSRRTLGRWSQTRSEPSRMSRRSASSSLRTTWPTSSKAIAATFTKLEGTVPLIGFSGAPFTLAAYMIEGGPSRNLERTKATMYSEPEALEALMTKLMRTVTDYLIAQVSMAFKRSSSSTAGSGASHPRTTSSLCSHTPGRSSPRSRSPENPLLRGLCVPDGGLPPDGSGCAERRLEGADRDVWTRCSGRTGVQGNLDPASRWRAGA